ncbi:MAG TPA: cellulase family glycosylhydrolase [Hyphomicrobiaceae bacterium]|nr:cellulase family glycosylhydrolase [Hyphomicrobiaceae bacterium]
MNHSPSRLGFMSLCLAPLALFLLTTGVGASMLTVSPDGILLKDGKPYRGVGVNIADAFHRLYLHPGDYTYDRDFATLEAEGIPFARIPATAYAPHDVRDYVLHRDAYLQKLDGVIKSAEKHHIGLILDLFWWHVAVPDIVHEPGSAWGDPDSRTIAFMREYTHTIVARYKDSPAVWAWEFGNEFSLAADLPNAADWRPPINPIIGWPDKRTKADDIRTPMILVAFTEFAKAVRDIDPDAAITTGNSIPRPNAESQRKTLTWDTVDTRADFRANLARVNPDPMNMIQIHLYAFDLKRFRQSRVTYADIIEQAMRVAGEQKKPLFIGEMSSATVWPELKTEADVKRDFEDRLNAILDYKVPLSAVWQVSTSLTFANDPLSISRARGTGWMLDDIKAANERIAGELEAEQRVADLLPQFEAAIAAADRDTIRALQQRLLERGFKPGSADGSYGPATKRALTACITAGSCTLADLPPASPPAAE